MSLTIISLMQARFWISSQISKFYSSDLGQNFNKSLWTFVQFDSSNAIVELVAIIDSSSSDPKLVNLYKKWFEQSPAAKRYPDSSKFNWDEGAIVSKYYTYRP